MVSPSPRPDPDGVAVCVENLLLAQYVLGRGVGDDRLIHDTKLTCFCGTRQRPVVPRCARISAASLRRVRTRGLRADDRVCRRQSSGSQYGRWYLVPVLKCRSRCSSASSGWRRTSEKTSAPSPWLVKQRDGWARGNRSPPTASKYSSPSCSAIEIAVSKSAAHHEVTRSSVSRFGGRKLRRRTGLLTVVGGAAALVSLGEGPRGARRTPSSRPGTSPSP